MCHFEETHDFRVKLDLSEFDDAFEFIINRLLRGRGYFHYDRNGAGYSLASKENVNVRDVRKDTYAKLRSGDRSGFLCRMLKAHF